MKIKLEIEQGMARVYQAHNISDRRAAIKLSNNSHLLRDRFRGSMERKDITYKLLLVTDKEESSSKLEVKEIQMQEESGLEDFGLHLCGCERVRELSRHRFQLPGYRCALHFSVKSVLPRYFW